VFCIYSESAKGKKAEVRIPVAQRTLEGFS
jgi:hypothetical protein